MKNYEILEDNLTVRAKIESIIKKLDLEEHLVIFHPPTMQNTCPLEVKYKIKEGRTRKDFSGGTLKIYIDELQPRIIMTDGQGALNLRMVQCLYDLENTGNRFADILVEDVLIEIYSRHCR